MIPWRWLRLLVKTPYLQLSVSLSSRSTKIVACATLPIAAAIAAACGGDSTGIIPGKCRSVVDTVKQVTTGTISAYIDPIDANASYLLQINNQDYVGNPLQNSHYGIFGGLPSGTFTVHWAASGCEGDEGEEDIAGPSSITVP